MSENAKATAPRAELLRCLQAPRAQLANSLSEWAVSQLHNEAIEAHCVTEHGTAARTEASSKL
eukprot:2210205-Amphidinium_carterae.1